MDIDKVVARLREPRATGSGVLSEHEQVAQAHVTSIFNKLGVSSRAEAVAEAMRSGLLPVEF